MQIQRDLPVTVYLRGPFTYEIAALVQAGSNTILTGDSTAKMRLKKCILGGNL